MHERQFAIPSDQIQPLAMGKGGCLATDMITVMGQQVGYMYCEESDFNVDSGWRFLSGNESQEYLDNCENIAIYDVNTIANYDPDIIPFLDAPVGSAFARDLQTGRLAEIEPGAHR